MSSVASSAGLIHLGLDASKNRIAVGVLRPEQQVPDVDVIVNDEPSVRRLIDRFPDRALLRVCYEAGPTGFGLYRLLTSMGVACEVIAPALIPKAPSDRVKTDRRDCRRLARLHRAGELVVIRAPEISDYERALAAVIDVLRPDVLHAHDVQVVGIAAAAAERARSAGREVRWIYDAHEFVPGLSEYGNRTRRVVAAWTDVEQEYVCSATRVITVSPRISAELQRIYRFPRPPAVVLNAPVVDRPEAPPPTLRRAVGLPDSTPLVVYSGMMTTARGVHIAIEAMKLLPGVHLAPDVVQA